LVYRPLHYSVLVFFSCGWGFMVKQKTSEIFKISEVFILLAILLFLAAYFTIPIFLPAS